MSVAAHFDAKAATYESGRLARWYRAQGEVVLALLEPKPGEVVLDLGSGSGWLLRQLLRGRPGVRGVGVDVSPRMVEVAKSRARDEGIDAARFMTGDWMRLDPAKLLGELGVTAVDTVLCVSSFHYFVDPASAARKIFSVLRPGGRFLLLDRALEGSAASALWDFLHRRVLHSDVRFHRTSELCAILEGAGFPRVEVARRFHRYLWKGKLYTALALIWAEKET